jgi:O-glycosyl hydrolase
MLRRTQVDFSKPLRAWDGFGVNYVEVAQTRDYDADPQEYGGFSILTEGQRQEIIDLIFGEDGLKPGLVKMFLDPFHQPQPGPDYDRAYDMIDTDAYDHQTTTRWMTNFVREGLKTTRAGGRDLSILVTLYGPPAWMTLQRFVRGRDLDPEMKGEVAKYIVAWAKHLREIEGFPIHYVGVHNEGEDWMRWPADGSTADAPSHDYNMYWPPEQVAEFMALIPQVLRAQGMDDVGVAPGETTNWYRFAEWGYAAALAEDPEAIANLGLITSHGFKGAPQGRWYGDWRSLGIDIIREKRPGLHAWVTSTSWSAMDVWFIDEIRNNIYSAKVNGIIPWACIQRPGKWVGGDPNPGTAIRVYDDGHYEVTPGYHFYKQVSRVGQPGMAVVHVTSNDSEIGLMAFASNGTDNSDAFVVLNMADHPVPLTLDIAGTQETAFAVTRTSPDEAYVTLGDITRVDGRVPYTAPPGSVTTFLGKG